MKKARILWGFWLLFSFIFWFWTDNYLGSLLPFLSIFIPVIFALLTKFHVKYLEGSISASVAGMKKQFVKGKIFIKNNSFFPLERVTCVIEEENLLTGERFLSNIHTEVPAHKEIEQEVEFTSKHCGKIRLSMTHFLVYDPFGLFCYSIPVESEAVTLFHPEIFQLEAQIVYGESLSLDSDMFSMVKPGSDSSEIFAIREYRPGDRIRQMHWKLSEKLDVSMVKEYGLPIQNTILLVLETGIMPGVAWPEASCMDAIAESLFSLSETLMENQTVHSIAWYNHAEQEFYCEEVNDEGELMALYPHVLSAVPGEDNVSVLNHYMECHEQFEFAHVVIFTPYHLTDLTAFEGYCLIMEVICESKAAGIYQEQGIRVISVTPDSKEQELVYLEI